MDDHNHGTHVSGTIGGVGNNGIGVLLFTTIAPGDTPMIGVDPESARDYGPVNLGSFEDRTYTVTNIAAGRLTQRLWGHGFHDRGPISRQTTGAGDVSAASTSL